MKTHSAVPTQVTNINTTKLHSNPSTKYGQRTDGCTTPKHDVPSVCLRRHRSLLMIIGLGLELQGQVRVKNRVSIFTFNAVATEECWFKHPGGKCSKRAGMPEARTRSDLHFGYFCSEYLRPGRRRPICRATNITSGYFSDSYITNGTRSRQLR